jgi:hypothetical protein
MSSVWCIGPHPVVATHIGARGIAAGDTAAAFACGVHAIMNPTVRRCRLNR